VCCFLLKILTNALGAYFSSQKWKFTLGKEMMVSHCVTITTLNAFKPTTQQNNSTNTNPMFQFFLPNRDNLNVHSMFNDFSNAKLAPFSSTNIRFESMQGKRL
jgi:hypothetical protein